MKRSAIRTGAPADSGGGRGRQGLGPPAPRMEQQDQRRRNRSEQDQNFSEGVPAGQVRGKCRITSCQFTSFSCTEIYIRSASSGSTSEVRVRGAEGRLWRAARSSRRGGCAWA